MRHVLLQENYILSLKGRREIAGGEVDYKIDTSRLTGELKTHGDDLNSIADGLSVAVEQRIKSERMKTELITNVSHDIKTPLTSIINYVDLLKKTAVGRVKLRNMLILLKRMPPDLKSSPKTWWKHQKRRLGVLAFSWPKLIYVNCLTRRLGEYSERLAVHQIEPVVEVPETPVYILADGRLMWRIIDNLLSNAAKYSQEGTRLYISLVQRDEKIILEMKNISKTRAQYKCRRIDGKIRQGRCLKAHRGQRPGTNIAKVLPSCKAVTCLWK